MQFKITWKTDEILNHYKYENTKSWYMPVQLNLCFFVCLSIDFVQLIFPDEILLNETWLYSFFIYDRHFDFSYILLLCHNLYFGYQIYIPKYGSSEWALNLGHILPHLQTSLSLALCYFMLSLTLSATLSAAQLFCMLQRKRFFFRLKSMFFQYTWLNIWFFILWYSL